MTDPAVKVVLLTGPDEAAIVAIAELVVGRGLAACVTVIPGARSVYRWEGEVHREPEALGIIKTTESALADLRNTVLEAHPYDVPEWLVLPVESGSPAYLDWVVGNTSGGSR